MSQVVFYDVSKRYTIGTTMSALQGITFSVEPGEFTALAGPSGSGKTTVLNLAAGLDVPSHGKVVLLGRDITQLSQEEAARLRRDSVGFIFQAHNLFPVLTAVENIEYPLALRKIATKQRRQLALQALADVGLAELANRFPSQMSGGQQQRVAIARAMVTSPSIVFADEPTASLDSGSAERLLLLFRTLNETRKTTFLFSSHDPLVLNIARRVISLTDGKIQKDATRPPHLAPAVGVPMPDRQSEHRGLDAQYLRH